MHKNYIIVLLLIFAVSCRQTGKKTDSDKVPEPEVSTPAITRDTFALKVKEKEETPDLNSLPDTTFIRLADYSEDFAYELRYATNNNFLKARVYDCAECYTRVKTAKALLAANEEFMKQGYKILFFDCYRPNSVQYKMWEIVPNPQYVANPVKGSVHNRGGAVDISLVTLEGEGLDMGTDFDYFGRRAYHDNFDLSEEILSNRKLLKETMERYGFQSIRTEWWHYNYTAAYRDPVADFRWPCN